jgi:hypothetical protein
MSALTGTLAATPHSRSSRTPSRILWAQLLARIDEVLPLLCPACGGEMTVISFWSSPRIRSGKRKNRIVCNLQMAGWAIEGEWISGARPGFPRVAARATGARPGVTKDLLDLFDLEPLEKHIYRGQNRDIGTKRVFGGQVLAQALVAARRTVEDHREAHSLHACFILPGDLKAPIVYFVDTLRDGGSFTTRRVTAIQQGRAIFNLSASFHRAEEGIKHQAEGPDLPDPEGLTPELERIRATADLIPPDGCWRAWRLQPNRYRASH